MIRVAYVTLAPIVSGAERALQTILINAEKENVKPLVICPDSSPLIPWLEEKNIEFKTNSLKPFEKTNAIAYLLQSIKLYKILKSYRIQIVHSNQIWSLKPVSHICSYLKIPTVCHLRDPIDSDSRWWINKKIDHVICISRHVEKEFTSHIDRKLYENLHTRIDPVHIKPSLSSLQLANIQSQAKSEMLSSNIGSAHICYGFVGQISQIKGLDKIIETLAKVENKQWTLLIAGKCSGANRAYLSYCNSLARDLGVFEKLVYLGFQEYLDDFYHAVDLILMFSLKEPLGLIPLEAGTFYTPSMASNLDGLPETIDNNSSGWLICPKDSVGNAKLLDRLTISDFSKAGELARKKVEAACSAASYMKFLKDVYMTGVKQL